MSPGQSLGRWKLGTEVDQDPGRTSCSSSRWHCLIAMAMGLRESIKMSDLSTDSPPQMKLEQIEARLPLLQRIAADLMQLVEKKHLLIKNGQKSGRGSGSGDSSEQLVFRDELRLLETRLGSLKEELAALGGKLVDLDSATIEFLGTVDSNIAWISWRAGDDAVRAWRPVDGEPGDRFALPGCHLEEGDLETRADENRNTVE